MILFAALKTIDPLMLALAAACFIGVVCIVIADRLASPETKKNRRLEDLESNKRHHEQAIKHHQKCLQSIEFDIAAIKKPS
jgi:hypothetical protein